MQVWNLKQENLNEKVTVLHTTLPRTFKRSQNDVSCKDVEHRRLGLTLSYRWRVLWILTKNLEQLLTSRTCTQLTLTLFICGFFLRQNQRPSQFSLLMVPKYLLEENAFVFMFKVPKKPGRPRRERFRRTTQREWMIFFPKGDLNTLFVLYTALRVNTFAFSGRREFMERGELLLKIVSCSNCFSSAKALLKFLNKLQVSNMQ